MKRTIAVLAAVLMLVLALAGCAPKGEAAGNRTITPQEGKQMLEEDPSVLLVDVRRADEYEAERIGGALNVPNESIGSERPEALPDQDAKIIVYCRTGVRSKEAAKKLKDLGYKNVYDMGGIADWPYDTVKAGETPAPTASAQPEKSPGDAGEQGSILSAFETTDLYGEAADASIFEGYDLTLINVWATFCRPCVKEMPDLAALAEEYAEKNVRVVGLVSDVLNYDGTISDEQVETAKAIVDKTQANYLHLLPSKDLLGLLSQIDAVPTTFFVDSQGRQVGKTYLGARSGKDWGKIIDQMLEEGDN